MLVYNVHMQIRFTQSARKHRIGKAHAFHVMERHIPIRDRAEDGSGDRLVWIGEDDRGLELEIVAIELPEYLLVIHVMATDLRRRKFSGN